MQIGKYIMVVGLLSLFFSFGYAQSKGITEQQAETILQTDFNLSETECDVAMFIFDELNLAWVDVSADKFRELLKWPKDIETVRELFPQVANNDNLTATISEAIDEWKSYQDLDDISDEKLDNIIASTEQHRASTEQHRASTEQHRASTEQNYKDAKIYDHLSDVIDKTLWQ